MPPLAERLRPKTLHELIGQEHLTGKGSVLRNSIENGKIPSMILWGPPGVGKTTIAHIIAQTLDVPFYTLSAISSGVKEVREVIEESKKKEANYQTPQFGKPESAIPWNQPSDWEKSGQLGSMPGFNQGH